MAFRLLADRFLRVVAMLMTCLRRWKPNGEWSCHLSNLGG
jgi:hypothetical protein